MAIIRQIGPLLSREVLDEADHVLRAGGVVALPTETFYALAASPFDVRAVERVGQIKGRPEGKPILILIANREGLSRLARHVPREAEVLMDRFWPGPLTIVLPSVSSLPLALTGATETIGVRQPNYPLLGELLKKVGPVTGTSANRSGASAARRATEVQDALGGEIDLILDGGMTPGGPPSTVVSVVGSVRLLREGRIERAVLREALAAIGIDLEHSRDNTYTGG